jgi:hypothetical protein
MTNRFLLPALFFLNLSLYAQNSPAPVSSDTARLQAWILEWSGSFFNNMGHASLAFVNQNDWKLGLRYSNGTLDAPELPADYADPVRITYDPKAYGGNFGLNFDYTSLPEKKTLEPRKYYNLVTVFGGKRWNLNINRLFLHADLGFTALIIDEPVDFVFVPGWEETNPNSGVKTIQKQGYTYSRKRYVRPGLHARLGLEWAFAREIGLYAGTETIFAPKEWLPGLFIGVVFGRLR